MEKTLNLRFGAMSPSIKEQLTEQNLKFRVGDVNHFQKDSEAIVRLKIRGLLNDSTAKKAQDSLFKKITSHVVSHSQ